MIRNVLLILCIAFEAFTKVIYVSPAGSGIGTELSPLGSVQSAISAAVNGDTVIMEDGTYHEHNIHLFSKKIVLGSRYVLDGDTTHRERCIIDADSTNSDSGSVFAINESLDSSTKLIGFTMTRGTGTLRSAAYGSGTGGAIYTNLSASTVQLTIEFCAFVNNHTFGNGYGGAIYGGAHIFKNCRFDNNSAYGGGALASKSGSTVGYTLIDCELFNNFAGNSSGVASGSYYTFTNCSISNNSAKDGGAFTVFDAVFNNCVISFNRFTSTYELQNGGAFKGGDATLNNCLVIGNSGPAFGSGTFTLNNCTVTDNFNSKNTDIANAGTMIVNNSIVTGSYDVGTFSGSYSLLEVLFADNIDTTGPGLLFGLDPLFVNPANYDYHLLSTSPAIDAGNPLSSYDHEPAPNGGRVNMGAYGNTAEATPRANNAIMTFSPSSFSRQFFNGERKYDTLTISNSSTDPLVISNADAIQINDTDLICTGISITDTILNQNETVDVYLTYSAGAVRNETIPIQVNFAAQNSPAIVNYTVKTLYENYDYLFNNDWNFGYVPVGDTTTKTCYLKNMGTNTIRVDSLIENSHYFTLVSGYTDFTVAPGDSQAVVAQFHPGGAVDYTIPVSLYSSNLLEVDTTLILSGNALDGGADADPTAAISAILPNPVDWGIPVTAVGSAKDNDQNGTGDEITAYAWRIWNDVDTFAFDTANISNFPSESLSIGWNYISFTAQDNEGIWADIAKDSILMNGLTPQVDSLWHESGLILRTNDSTTFQIIASDRDEFATAAVNNGDIQSVTWFSSIDDTLGKTNGFSLKVATVDLSLGMHKIWVEVTDNENQVGVSDTLTIPVQNSMGHAVIVTGTSFGETSYFYKNIATNANFAYKRLRDRGFSNEQIFYMNPVSWQSIDGDPLKSSNIVDESEMTLANLKAHLELIAQDVKNDIPLVIYLLGHGSNSDQNNAKFYLNETEYVNPVLLNEWLNEYGDLSTNRSYITVIADFCYSGGFIAGLQSNSQKRAVVTSADAKSAAYFSRNRSFSMMVFNETYRGKNLRNCFEYAQSWSNQNAPGTNQANPQIDCNGDGVVNSAEDMAIAETIYLGGAQQLQGLIAEVDSLHVTLNSGIVTIDATVSGDVDSLKCRVVPIDGDLNSVDFSTAPLFALTQNDTGWSGSFNGFTQGGSYLLLVEGVDAASQAMQSVGEVIDISETGIAVREAPMSLFFTPAQIGGATRLNFGLPQASDVKINIYDLRGRVVNQIVQNGLQAGYYSIPVTTLGAGFYITHFSTNSEMIQSKLIVR